MDSIVERNTASVPTPFFDRSANERLILSIIRRAGALPSAEIARLAGLSAQSASVITRSLEGDGLIVKGDPLRGKVGKPLTPFMLNKDGAFSVGLRIGRRSADMVLLDLTGNVRGHIRSTFPFPTPKRIIEIARGGLRDLMALLRPAEQARVAGFGVAAPFELWKWLDGTATPKAEMLAWRDFDFVEGFSAFTDLPIMVGNDGSLACEGEHAFGNAADFANFVYFYVGSFIGGGAVLDNRVYLGANGNAAALGSLPVRGSDGHWKQLISQASVVQLEERLEAHFPGRGQEMLGKQEWAGFENLLEDWLTVTCESIAYAVITMVAAFDVPEAVIDCGTPDAIRKEIVSRVDEIVAKADSRGLQPLRISEGKLGPMAGALGAAHKPIVSRLLVE